MKNGWNRVNECKACGKSDCVESTINKRQIYCFRFGKTLYIRSDGTTTAQDKTKNTKKDKGQMTLFSMGEQYGDD